MLCSNSRHMVSVFLAFLLPTLTAFGQPAVPPSTQPSQQNPIITPQQDPRLTPLPRVPSGQVTANKPSVSMSSADQTIASILSICNQKESQLGGIAKRHSENSKVKEFADTMTRDHTEMATTLQRFGAQTGLVASSQTNQADRSATNNNQAAPSGTPADSQQQSFTHNASLPGVQGGGLDFVSIHRQIAQQCLSDAEKEWSSKKASSECDMGYIGSQIVAHKEMIVSAKVLRQYASPELQKVIDQGAEKAESHLSQAKQLIDTLASEEHDRTAKK